MDSELFIVIALGIFLGNLPLVLLNIWYFGKHHKKSRKLTSLWNKRFYQKRPDEKKILKLEEKKAQVWLDIFRGYFLKSKKIMKGGEK